MKEMLDTIALITFSIGILFNLVFIIGAYIIIWRRRNDRHSSSIKRS